MIDVSFEEIDVSFEETDGDEVLRRFFLYPGPHDKITDCLLSCWSADAPPFITKGGRSLCWAFSPAPSRIPDWPRSVHGTPLTGGRDAAALNSVQRRPALLPCPPGVASFVRPARPRGKKRTCPYAVARA